MFLGQGFTSSVVINTEDSTALSAMIFRGVVKRFVIVLAQRCSIQLLTARCVGLVVVAKASF